MCCRPGSCLDKDSLFAVHFEIDSLGFRSQIFFHYNARLHVSGAPSLTPSSVRNSQTYFNEAEMFWTHHGALVNDSYQYRYKVHSAKQCPLNDG